MSNEENKVEDTHTPEVENETTENIDNISSVEEDQNAPDIDVDLDTVEDNVSNTETTEDTEVEDVPVEVQLETVLTDIPTEFDEQLQVELDQLCGHNNGKELTANQEFRRRSLILLKESVALRKRIDSGEEMFGELEEFYTKNAIWMYVDSQLEYTWENKSDEITEEDV